MEVDENLLVKMASGDEGAATACFTRYRDFVARMARRVRLPAAEIDDAVQDVFIKLWRSASGFDPSVSSERNFVRVVATSSLVDSLRRQGRRLVAESLSRGEEVVGDPPVDFAEMRDELTRVWRAMERMGRDARRILELHLLRGLSYPAIAKQLGRPVAAVKTTARRARIGLQMSLGVAP